VALHAILRFTVNFLLNLQKFGNKTELEKHKIRSLAVNLNFIFCLDSKTKPYTSIDYSYAKEMIIEASYSFKHGAYHFYNYKIRYFSSLLEKDLIKLENPTFSDTAIIF
jgi:hypothetical protein